MYREKIKNMLPVFNEDERKLVEKTVDNAIRYNFSIASLNYSIEVLAHRLDGEEYRDKIFALDNTCQLSRDALNSRVNAVNRICDKYEMPKFYDGPEDRHKMATLAFDIKEDYDGIRSLFVENKSYCLK